MPLLLRSIRGARSRAPPRGTATSSCARRARWGTTPRRWTSRPTRPRSPPTRTRRRWSSCSRPTPTPHHKAPTCPPAPLPGHYAAQPQVRLATVSASPQSSSATCSASDQPGSGSILPSCESPAEVGSTCTAAHLNGQIDEIDVPGGRSGRRVEPLSMSNPGDQLREYCTTRADTGREEMKTKMARNNGPRRSANEQTERLMVAEPMMTTRGSQGEIAEVSRLAEFPSKVTVSTPPSSAAKLANNPMLRD